MKLLTHALPAALFAAMVSLSSLSYADDTEIYFARANADNEENRSVANVLIMLDTSGSMRFCQNELSGGSGYNAQWCSTVANRRINILQNALDQLLDSVSPSIRLGIGRFNYIAPYANSSSGGTGQIGGRILVPVTELTSDTKSLIRSQIQTLNGAGNNSSASAANAQPVGDTPTARAFSEAARYMMGMAPLYGTSANGAQTEVCAAEEEVDVNCRDEIVYGEPVSVDWCDSTSNQYQCDITTGNWSRMNSWDYCDLSKPEACRLRTGSNSWTSWSTSNTCDSSQSWCEREWRSSGGWGGGYSWQHRMRRFEERNVTYTQRLPTGELNRVCDKEMQCTTPLTIVESRKYVSPMNLANQCESNHIILFTDGKPSDNDKPSLSDVVSSNCSNNTSSYDCQVRIAKYLNSTSNAKGREVFTHNIGLYMGNNENDMRDVSNAGAGSTANADNAEQLIAAFLANLDLIDEQARSISAPGVAVNTQSRFQHLDELFYSVFQPAESSYWEGNLKKYKWSAEKDADGNVEGEIQGVGGSNAIDPSTGYFRDGSRSFWSSEADGSDVTKGGARENVPAERRLFYTSEAGGSLSHITWDSTSTPSNTLMGLDEDDDTGRAAVFQRLKTMWGDPLHSVPVVVNYSDSDPYANVAFISTNGGMLHAIDTKTGNEKFAFMPHEFLSQAERYTTDRPALGDGNKRLTYGLDGSWVAWQRSAGNGSKVYLYGGMRRGGQQYYALDVTDPDSPKMLWQIGPETSGFAKLGQTWSTPTLTQVWTGGEAVPALIFGAGYSPDDHDEYVSRSTADEMGNGIYIVNALSGDVIWSAGGHSSFTSEVAAMKWAIPSSIAVVDNDFDNIADHLYFGDLGGQVFRADLPGSDDSNVAVTKIADLGGASGANQRRFYEAPAVAYMRDGGDESLYVTISSGYRAHPLDETASDGIFVIRDKAALQGGGNTVATVANMTNAASSTDIADTGWYYLFSAENPPYPGEKALSSPTIFDGKILQTTYAPTAQDEDDNPCAVRYGAAFIYTVDLKTGAPAALVGEAPESRRQGIGQTTPPPTPTLLVDEEGNMIVVVGTEVLGEGDFGNPNLRRHRWMQLPRDEANAIKARGADDEEQGGTGQ